MSAEIPVMLTRYLEQCRAQQELYIDAIRSNRVDGIGTKDGETVILTDALHVLSDGALVVPSYMEYIWTDGKGAWTFALTIITKELDPIRIQTSVDWTGRTQGSVYTTVCEYAPKVPFLSGITTDLSGNVTSEGDQWLLEFQRFANHVVSLAYGGKN